MGERIVRFMSLAEAWKFLDITQKLHNGTKHIAKTDSIGFCFTPTKDSLHKTARHLSGITTMEIALVGILKDGVKWREGYGIYSDNDPETLMYPEKWKTQKLRELSTVRYSMEDFDSFDLYLPEPMKWGSQAWVKPTKLSIERGEDDSN